MRKALLAITILTVAVSAIGRAEGAPIGSRTLWETSTRGIQSPARTYDVLHASFELEPGQWSSLRNGQARFVLSVIEGEFTLLLGETKTVYRPGQTATVPPGITFRFGNESAAKTRLQETILTPAWQSGPPTILQPATSPVRVTTPAQRGNFNTIAPAPATVDVTQQGAEMDPGYSSPQVVANAFNLITVISGELTLRYADGTAQRLAMNQGGSMAVGKAVSLANEGQGRTSYLMSWLAAPGSPLTSEASPAPRPATISPPSTGDAGLAR